jgi:hypothetical protein
MSNFKRLANLAKGKVKSIFNPTDDGGLADLDRELDTMRPLAESGKPVERPAAPRSKKHDILDNLLRNGLLSQEEYAQKLGALDGTSPPPKQEAEPSKPRVPSKPKKRTL